MTVSNTQRQRLARCRREAATGLGIDPEVLDLPHNFDPWGPIILRGNKDGASYEVWCAIEGASHRWEAYKDGEHVASGALLTARTFP